MKRSANRLLAMAVVGMTTFSPASADLPQMMDHQEWMGYFVGWKNRDWDYGFGADGEGMFYLKFKKERRIHDYLQVNFFIQEPKGKKWTNRSAVGWNSDFEKGVNPRKPVPAILEVEGGGKAKFIQTLSKGMIMVKPELLENEAGKPTRLAVGLKTMDLSYSKTRKDLDERRRKKLLKGFTFEAKRKKDGKKISFNIFDKVNILGENMLAEGATEIEVGVPQLKHTLLFKQGNPKYGHFEIAPKGPLEKGFRIYWVITPEEAKQRDAWMSFGVK